MQIDVNWSHSEFTSFPLYSSPLLCYFQAILGVLLKYTKYKQKVYVHSGRPRMHTDDIIRHSNTNIFSEKQLKDIKILLTL